MALRGGVPTASGAVGVEGVRLVEEALASGCRVEAVLLGESGERHRERLAPVIGGPERGFPVLRTTDRLFEGLADTEHPQGVAALVVPRVWTLEEILSGEKSPGANAAPGAPGEETREEEEILPLDRQSPLFAKSAKDGAPSRSKEIGANTDRRAQPGLGMALPWAGVPLIVALAGVQDPGNVGTILRTAAAFGATAAITAATGQSGTASPFAPKALRASAGATLHLPVVSGMALGILLTQLKVRGIRTLASCVEEERSQITDIGYPERKTQDAKAAPGAPARALAPWEVDWCEAVALLVGNEGAGLPEDVVHGADARVHIPMAALPSSGRGQVESLNAAAAAAVVLYEAFRQRARKVGTFERRNV